MIPFKILILSCALALIVPALGAAAERAKAKVTCQSTGIRLVYECIIMLKWRTSGKPIDGAKIVVHADMPSMAMAHNVQPVEAVATGMPGVYKLRIALDMMGDWALRLNISGPLRDLVIAKHEFGTGHGMPADHSRSSTSGSHSSPGMPDGSQHKQ